MAVPGEDQLRSLFEQIAQQTDEDGKRTKVNELIELLHHSGTLTQWGRYLARRFASAGIHAEDTTNELTVGIIAKLMDLTPDLLSRVRLDLQKRLYCWGRDHVQAWCDSSAVTIAGEMSGIMRRRRAAAAKRSAMEADLGRQVADEEVVEAYNADALAARSDAAKQGALIDVDDVTGARVSKTSLDAVEYDLLTSAAPDPETRGALVATIRQLQTLAFTAFPGKESADDVSAAIGHWAAIALEGESWTDRNLRDRMGVSRYRAGQLVARVNAVLSMFRDQDKADAQSRAK
ncbi:hypothetical protein [Microbacterium xylanilyticum]